MQIPELLSGPCQLAELLRPQGSWSSACSTTALGTPGCGPGAPDSHRGSSVLLGVGGVHSDRELEGPSQVWDPGPCHSGAHEGSARSPEGKGICLGCAVHSLWVKQRPAQDGARSSREPGRQQWEDGRPRPPHREAKCRAGAGPHGPGGAWLLRGRAQLPGGGWARCRADRDPLLGESQTHAPLAPEPAHSPGTAWEVWEDHTGGPTQAGTHFEPLRTGCGRREPLLGMWRRQWGTCWPKKALGPHPVVWQ